MYYLRFEDRNKVTPAPGSFDPSMTLNLFWRLPFPDEDNVGIGNYQEFDRGLRLFKTNVDGTGYNEPFSDPSTIESPGSMQLTHPSGMLLGVKCYHGEKLPESTDDFKAHWNGKSWFYELVSIKNTAEGIFPVVKCRHCRSMWRYSWDEILPYISDERMRERLEVYAN